MLTKDEVLEDAWVLIVTSRQAYGNREPMPKWEAAKLKWLKDYGQVKDAVEPRAKLTHEEARSTICTGCGLTLYACICAPPNRLVEGYCCCPKSGTPHERTPQCDI